MHWSTAVLVLHVPQMRVFMSVRLDWALMKPAELCDSNENARQVLKGADWVMLVKKERHETLVKLRVN